MPHVDQTRTCERKLPVQHCGNFPQPVASAYQDIASREVAVNEGAFAFERANIVYVHIYELPKRCSCPKRQG